MGEGGRMPEQEVAEQVDHLAGRPRRSARRRSSAPSRARDRAATALAEGVAPSKTSLVRTMSSSASWPVVKKPPPSSSWNRSTERVGGGDGPIGPDRPTGQLGQAGEAVDQPGVVAGVGEMARTSVLPSNCAATDPPAPIRWPIRKSPMATAASLHAGLPLAAAASASDEAYMAFHSVSTLSSRPGRTRLLTGPRTGGSRPPRPPRGRRAGLRPGVGGSSCPRSSPPR